MSNISSNFFKKLSPLISSRTNHLHTLPLLKFDVAPPLQGHVMPRELPHIANAMEFVTIPMGKTADPPPLSPGPNPGPEFPGPPIQSPPGPEGPRPPVPSPPGEPEAFPPHGPDVIPPKPPGPGLPNPIKPDIPPPFMSSDGPH